MSQSEKEWMLWLHLNFQALGCKIAVDRNADVQGSLKYSFLNEA